jgi:hypothetical protein
MISHSQFSIVVLQVANHQTSYSHDLSGVLYCYGAVILFLWIKNIHENKRFDFYKNVHYWPIDQYILLIIITLIIIFTDKCAH